MAGLWSSAYLRPEAARRQRERNCLQGPEEKNVAAFLAKSECFVRVCIFVFSRSPFYVRSRLLQCCTL